MVSADYKHQNVKRCENIFCVLFSAIVCAVIDSSVEAGNICGQDKFPHEDTKSAVQCPIVSYRIVG